MALKGVVSVVMQNVETSTVVALLGLVAAAFILQRIYRHALAKERYFYMRDLSLLAGWALFALWSGDGSIRSVVAVGMMGAIAGMIQHTSPEKNLSWIIGAIGVIFAGIGPQISFIGLPGGEYLYLSSYESFVATALWVTVFPLLFQRLDGIPGLAGHLLGVSFSLALLISSISGQSIGEGFLMSLAGLAFTAVFWSRLGHNYRQLGKPLATFWGILVAGTSLMGVTKGVTFTALMVIPMGLYALPLAEASINIMSQAVPLGKWGRVSIYHRMIDKGMDHPKAVKFVTFLCLAIGSSVSFLQLGIDEITRPILFSILGVSFFVGLSCLRDSQIRRNSRFWGVNMDGISMNYALSKVRARLLANEPSAMVVTANALSLYKARKDPSYRYVADKAWLTLPDGAGLVWAMRLLGMSVVERVAGIDFMHGLSRLAATEKWPVYLLGSRPEIVAEASEKLKELYPGLVVAGYRDGYFDDEDKTVIKEIRESGARILFVALGMPKQDFWLNDNLPQLDGVLGVGVGGSLDVVSGKLKRAPEKWQKAGMEWLYRLIQEPRRFRQDLDLALFVLTVLMEKIGLVGGEVTDEKHSS